MTAILLRLLVLSLILVGLSSPRSATADETLPPHREILFISSYHKGDPWTDLIIEAFEKRLSDYRPAYDIHYEFMDKRRLAGADYERSLLALLRQKYDNVDLDLVICSGDEALDFALAHRQTFLRDVPLLFCGITDLAAATIGMGDAVTGVAEGVDVRGTVGVALKLFPQARTVAFINDSGNGGNVGRLIGNIRGQFPGVSFVLLENLSYQQLLARLNELPPDTVVVQGTYGSTSNPSVSFARYLQQLTKSVPFPVFSLWDHAVGNGVVGGKIVTAYAQGNEAGKIAVRLLKGEKPENLPVVLQDADRFMFDERQLLRFGLSKRALPDNSSLFPPRPPAKREIPWGVALPGAVGGLLFMWLRRFRVKRSRDVERMGSGASTPAPPY